MDRKLMNVHELVKEILEQDVQARCDDNYLIYKVMNRIGNKNGVNIASYSMPSFLLHMRENGFPAFESVRRARQTLQRKYPELQPSEEAKKARKALEKEYREYAREMK